MCRYADANLEAELIYAFSLLESGAVSKHSPF